MWKSGWLVLALLLSAASYWVVRPDNPTGPSLVVLFAELGVLLGAATLIATIKIGMAWGPFVALVPFLVVSFRPLVSSDSLGIISWIVLAFIGTVFVILVWLVAVILRWRHNKQRPDRLIQNPRGGGRG